MCEYVIKEQYELFTTSEIISMLKEEMVKYPEGARAKRVENAIGIVELSFKETHPPIAAIDITEDGNYCVMEIVGDVIIGMYVTDDGFEGFVYESDN